MRSPCQLGEFHLARPRKFHLHFYEPGHATISEGLKEHLKVTGQRYGHASFKTRRGAEEFAAWIEYRYGYPHSVNRPRPGLAQIGDNRPGKPRD